MWTGAPQCILLLGTNRHRERVPLTIAAALCLRRCHGTLVYIWFPLRLCLTTSRPHIWSSGRHWLSPSISSWLLSLPGELKAQREREREKENRRGKARAEVGLGTNTSRHLSLFPSMLCSSLEWFILCPSKERSFAKALHRTLFSFFIPQPINSIGQLLFCQFFGQAAENIWTLPTFPIRLLIMCFVYIIKGQHFYGWCDSCWFFCFQSRLSGWIFFSWTVGLAKSFTVWLWAGVGNYHTHSLPFISHSLTLFSYSCLSGLTFTVPPLS